MKRRISNSGHSGVVYVLGLIGAAVYLFPRQPAFGWEYLDS